MYLDIVSPQKNINIFINKRNVLYFSPYLGKKNGNVFPIFYGNQSNDFDCLLRCIFISFENKSFLFILKMLETVLLASGECKVEIEKKTKLH